MSLNNLLETERRRLLQLDGRNSLLNYKSYSKGIEASTPNSANLVWKLINSIAVSFFVEETPLQLFGIDNDIISERQQRTLVWSGTKKELSNRLFKLRKEAKSYIEERGVNILYIAIGILHWRESDPPGENLWKAPLFLIPVEIVTGPQPDSFHLVYNEEPIDANHSLVEALSQSCRISLPLPPRFEQIDVNNEVIGEWESWQKQCEIAISQKSGWRIDWNSTILGLFSFTKYLMYKDLDAKNWCNEENPEGPELLRQILFDGFGDSVNQYPDEMILDKEVAVDQPISVLDLDSSQAKVILEVQQGKSLVVEGPPGTGKSQTIANLLADAIKRGKTVLFVAEKRAALEVVKRRMEMVGLGKACLELHGSKAKKTELTKDLANILNNPSQAMFHSDFDLEELKNVIHELREWSDSTNKILPSGYTPFELIGLIIWINELLHFNITGGLPPFAAEELTDFRNYVNKYNKTEIGDVVDKGNARIEISSLQHQVKHLGTPFLHPFWGCELKVIRTQIEQESIRQHINEIEKHLQALSNQFVKSTSFLSLSLSPSLDNSSKLLRCFKFLKEVPVDFHNGLANKNWLGSAEVLTEAVKEGKELSVQRKQLLEILVESALEFNLTACRQILSSTKDVWWNRIGNKPFKIARKQVIDLFKNADIGKGSSLIKVVDTLVEYQGKIKVWTARAEKAKYHFEWLWKDLDSDWDLLQNGINSLTNYYLEVSSGSLPPSFPQTLSRGYNTFEIDIHLKDLAKCDQEVADNLRRFAIALEVADLKQREWLMLPIPDFLSYLHSMQLKLSDLSSWVTFRNFCRKLRADGKGLFVEIAEKWNGAHNHLEHLFLQIVWEQLFQQALETRPILTRMNGSTLEHLKLRFASLDSKLREYNKADLHNKLNKVIQQFGSAGQAGNLRRISQLSRRIPPIRDIIKDNFSALTSIKPIVMMSPLSVASYLEPSVGLFDMVIFDEASQIEPVDAYGAIMRGKQVIVVGDTKQLPPTNFFNRLLEEDGVVTMSDGLSGSVDSIMEVLRAKIAPKILRWHYRSRHHSLIEMSNIQFYDEQLLVFPSANPRSNKLGINFVKLDPSACPYESEGINSGEAKAVADAVLQYHRENPQKTIGVVAFNVK